MSDAAFPAGAVGNSVPRAYQVWGFLKQELLYICWALMEVALLTPFALFLMRWTRFWSAGQFTLWLLLLMLLPFNLVRLLSALQVQKRRQWQIALGALLITLLLTWRILLFNSRSILDASWLTDLYANFGESGSALWTRILILFLLLMLIWWRGLRLVSFNADINQVGLRLRIGILIFIPLSLLPYLRINVWGITPFVLLFFLAGLTALSLIRAEQLEEQRTGYSAMLSPRWIGTIFLTSLLVVLIAALFAAAVSGELVAVIAEWLSPVRTAVVAGTAVALITVFFLASPLFYVFDLLLIWLTQIFSSIFANFGDRLGLVTLADFSVFQSLMPDPDEVTETTGLSLPDSVMRIAAMLVMLAIVLLVSLALTRRFRSAVFAPRSSGPIGKLGAESGTTPGIGQRVLERLGLLRRWRTAASIRDIYRQMCKAAAGLGYARTESETPYEYLDSLTKVWPDGRPQSLLITEAYVRIRYGEIPETANELEEIREAWIVLEKSKPEE